MFRSGDCATWSSSSSALESAFFKRTDAAILDAMAELIVHQNSIHKFDGSPKARTVNPTVQMFQQTDMDFFLQTSLVFFHRRHGSVQFLNPTLILKWMTATSTDMPSFSSLEWSRNGRIECVSDNQLSRSPCMEKKNNHLQLWFRFLLVPLW